MTIHLKASASIAGLALVAAGFAGVCTGAAHADRPAPCAQQQTQVDRAADALARVTAVFARQQARVAAAQDEVAEADTPSERAAARQDLARANSKRDEVRQTKRAQQQRLTRAQARLDKCAAAQPPTDTPVED